VRTYVKRHINDNIQTIHGLEL